MEAMASGRIAYPARVVELFAVEDEVVDRVGALADRSPWELLKRLGYPPALLRTSARNAAFDVEFRRIVNPAWFVLSGRRRRGGATGRVSRSLNTA